MIVVIGASGNTGSVVAAKLLDAGRKIRAVGRHKEKLASLEAKGAEVFSGDVTDIDAMARAFAGASAAYVMIPPDVSAPKLREYQSAVAESLASALERAKVPQAVALSTVGAELAEGAGPVSGVHAYEERLKRVPGLNVLSLRPAYFLENFLMSVGMIRSTGMFAGLIDGDVSLPMIAARDVGARAADALQRLGFTGFQTQELLGARDYTMKQAASIIGNAIGKPSLSYTKAPAFMAKPALRNAGLSADTVDQFIEMCDAISDRRMVPLETRNAANTTPTTFEEFAAEVLAPAFHGKSATA